MTIPFQTRAVSDNPPYTSDPRDNLDRDALLVLWNDKKQALEYAKNEEMELRRYIVGRAFPSPSEGMNKIELGAGYELKAQIKYNYNLDDNEKVEAGLDKLAKTGNDGSFIAERLVNWHPKFLLTEYRAIEEAAKEGNPLAKERLQIISTFLTITDGAPTLEIKAPKGKK